MRPPKRSAAPLPEKPSHFFGRLLAAARVAAYLT